MLLSHQFVGLTKEVIMLFCFVDNDGNVFRERMPETVRYFFSLTMRRAFIFEKVTFSDDSLPFLPKPEHYTKVREHFENILGTPGKLMTFAQNGHLSKLQLAELLLPDKKSVYFDACARFEKALTEACRQKNEPCLENGCAISEEEACLNAILEAGEIYTKACVSMWIYLFINPENRIPVWKN